MNSPVVVGIDGSSASLEALRWAVDYADGCRAPLRLVYASGLSMSHGPRTTERAFSERALNARSAEILAEAEKLALESTAQPGRIEIATTVAEHEPAVSLLAHARGANMLVVGAQGIDAIERGVLGSVSVAVADRADCPVTIVPTAPLGHPSPGRLPVVVGVDGTPSGKPALEFAFAEARRRVVGVVAVTAWFTSFRHSSRREARAHTIARQARVLADPVLRHPAVPVERVVLEGRPARHLLHEADGAQLLVLGRRSPTPPGAVTHAVLPWTPVPVIIVGRPR
ncbi:universal stress protein [Nocardia sp. A7]|uniref:universal stress protein n=1 Tax=Nocardia sp. A7 TaxID=2789274 RepID=UPI00397D487A